MVDITIVFMGIISWCTNQPTFTSLVFPILQLAEGQGEAVAGAPLISTV